MSDYATFFDYLFDQRELALRNARHARAEGSYLTRAPLHLLNGHLVTQNACFHLHTILSEYVYEIPREYVQCNLREFLAIDDVKFWNAQEYFSAARNEAIDGSPSYHHRIMKGHQQLKAMVAYGELFQGDSGETIAINGEELRLTLQEAIEFGMASREKILEHVTSETCDMTTLAIHRTVEENEMFDHMREACMDYWATEIRLTHEFFRAWKLFFPGKPGEDYDTIEQASPEERKEILRQAEELSTSNGRGRPPALHVDAERFLEFHYTKKGEFATQKEYADWKGLEPSTISGSFRRVRGHFGCGMPSQKDLEKLAESTGILHENPPDNKMN